MASSPRIDRPSRIPSSRVLASVNTGRRVATVGHLHLVAGPAPWLALPWLSWLGLPWLGLAWLGALFVHLLVGIMEMAGALLFLLTRP